MNLDDAWIKTNQVENWKKGECTDWCRFCIPIEKLGQRSSGAQLGGGRKIEEKRRGKYAK